MIFNIEFWCKEEYLPTKRHRKLRSRYVKKDMDVEIKEMEENEFPVAFIVHEYKTVYENAQTYVDFDGSGDFRMFAEEIRTYDGNLYMPVRVSHGAAISLCFEPLEYIKRSIENYEPYWKGGINFTENSIIKKTDVDECKKFILNRSNRYVIFNNQVWKKCSEPMYVINTFGLGHNHGGTGFFIEYYYNDNIPNSNYFNALEREKAIEYGKTVAARRGDTKSIGGMGDHEIIEVLMPEMVKRNPKSEHGNGDPYINSLENIINETESSMEAGLLVVAMMQNNLSK